MLPCQCDVLLARMSYFAPQSHSLDFCLRGVRSVKGATLRKFSSWLWPLPSSATSKLWT